VTTVENVDLDRRDPNQPSAMLDTAHVGDINGAFGTIRLDDTGPRRDGAPAP
jgi:hypothetical protein